MVDHIFLSCHSLLSLSNDHFSTLSLNIIKNDKKASEQNGVRKILKSSSFSFFRLFSGGNTPWAV
jgi:hypothetical protein